MRGCKVPNSEEVIRKYAETGNDTYWYEFIELMREGRRTEEAEAPPQASVERMRTACSSRSPNRNISRASLKKVLMVMLNCHDDQNECRNTEDDKN